MANKALTIKGASDEELEALRRRLQNENEVARLIADLRCRSNGSNSYATNPYEGISTEVPIDDLYHSEAVDEVLMHFGIPGMKWGKRKARGSSEKTPRALKAADKKWSKNSSKKIASAMNSLNDDKDFNKAVTKLADKIMKDNKISDKDFVYQRETARMVNEKWAKDKSMYSPSGKKRLAMGTVLVNGTVFLKPYIEDTEKTAKHSDDDDIEIDDVYYVVGEDGLLEEADPTTYLAHYGILGMKWGKRKAKASTNPSEDHKRAQSLKGKKISEMSNSELRDLTQRLQLERQYKDLKKSEISEGQKLVTGILKDIGRDMLKEAIRSGVKAGSKASSKALKNKLNK